MPDGSQPAGPLLNVNGTLYGTTYVGGTGRGCNGSDGCGTVFIITPAGKEHVIYSFAGSFGKDGANPYTSLLDIHGTLYGTTSQGGVPGASESYTGLGTVFAATTSGQESILHSFAGGTDGANPAAGLAIVNGQLYGTTFLGGTSGCTGGYGCGTVFSITTAVKERIRYAFTGADDSEGPRAGVTRANGILYGTASGGAEGLGTVFTLKP